MNQEKHTDPLLTREGVLDLMDTEFKLAKDIFTAMGEVRPMACLLITVNPKTGEKLDQIATMQVCMIDQTDSNAMNQLCENIRRISSTLGAVGVIMIAEVWSAKFETEEEGMKWAGRMQDHPDRKETVFVTLEHKTLGQMSWHAPILREEGKASLGEFENMETTKFSGMATRMLASQHMN